VKIAGQWFREILALLYRRRTATRGEIIQSTGLNPACVGPIHGHDLLLDIIREELARHCAPRLVDHLESK
jgi:hypothetical protein